MARPRRSWRFLPPAQAQPLLPEVLLIGAILGQAVEDARGRRMDRVTPTQRARVQADAQAFLRDQSAVGLLVELMGADVAGIQRALLRAADLAPSGRRELEG